MSWLQRSCPSVQWNCVHLSVLFSARVVENLGSLCHWKSHSSISHTFRDFVYRHHLGCYPWYQDWYLIFFIHCLSDKEYQTTNNHQFCGQNPTSFVIPMDCRDNEEFQQILHELNLQYHSHRLCIHKLRTRFFCVQSRSQKLTKVLCRSLKNL